MRQLKSKDVAIIREEILVEQNGICPICKKNVVGPCLDHQHTKRIKGTGQIRGVLCRACNIFLGKAENNCVRFNISQKDLPDILRAISDYLEKPQYPLLHPSEAPKKPILSKNCFKQLNKEYINTYPKRKPLEYPKSKHLTQHLEKMFVKFNIEIKFLGGRKWLEKQ